MNGYFLHDTTLALILLDPTRGQTAFDEVEGWNKRLDKQLGGRKITKLLVATKRDQRRGFVDRQRLELLIERCAFQDYLDVSAKDGTGIDDLTRAISDALDWESLARTRRPELFQGIREAIEARRGRGEIVIYASDLQAEIEPFTPRHLRTTLSQLLLSNWDFKVLSRTSYSRQVIGLSSSASTSSSDTQAL